MFFLTRPLVSFGPVYHEELNAPIRRNKEEPKARPLRVGDTEKPEPEREYSGCLGTHGEGELGQAGTRAGGWRIWAFVRARDCGHVPSLFQAPVSLPVERGW